MNNAKLWIIRFVMLLSVPCYPKGGTNSVVYTAVTRGDVAKLKELFDADPKLLSLRNSLLRTAALNGQKDSAEFLIAQGADVNERGFFNLTPLAHMAMYGTRDDQKCAEVAAVLLSHGAEIDPVDDYQGTPLLHAVEMKKGKLARVLLEHGADPNRRYGGVNNGKTPLHMAVMHADKTAVAALLQFKAPVGAVDRDGATALLIAEARDESDIAALLRAADPQATQGTPHYTPAPSREAMRDLARRIALGDAVAFNELATTTDKLYGEIKDYGKEHARVMLLLFRMHAAFDLLGDEAGQGNEKALAALKNCLQQQRHLTSFAPDAIGRAAAKGNREALDILLNYKQWQILDTSALFALCVPAAANVEPAVDYFAHWLINDDTSHRRGGIFMDATNALGQAAAKGNVKARETLTRLAGLPE